MMCNTSLLNAESIRIRGDSNVPQRILQSCSLQSDEDVRLAVCELGVFVEGGGAVDQFLDAAVSVCNSLPYVISGKLFLLLSWVLVSCLLWIFVRLVRACILENDCMVFLAGSSVFE